METSFNEWENSGSIRGEGEVFCRLGDLRIHLKGARRVLKFGRTQDLYTGERDDF